MEKIDLGGKTANIKSAYRDLKDGYTIIVGGTKMYIYTCDRWGSPSYGKDYIALDGYGFSAITVNFKDFADKMRYYNDYKGTYGYCREY